MEIGKKKNLVLCLVVFVCMMLFMHTNAWADDTASVTLTVTQEYSEKNNIPSNLNRTFKYLLKAEDANNPLPSGGANGSYNFSLTSSATKKLTMSYSTVGTYKYKLKQVIPSSKISGMTYDDTVYEITVSVKNSSNGLAAYLYIGSEGSSYKRDTAEFDVSYKGSKSGSSSSSSSSSSSGSSSGSRSSSGSGSESSSSYASSGGTGLGDSGVLGDRMAPETDSGVLAEREAPKTGDNARPIVWISLMVASAIMIIFALTNLKKKVIYTRERN